MGTKEILEILQSDVIDDPEDLLMWLCGDGVQVLKEHAALEAEVERLRETLIAFVAIDWDGLLAEAGGTPALPDGFYDWDVFMDSARAALAPQGDGVKGDGNELECRLEG